MPRVEAARPAPQVVLLSFGQFSAGEGVEGEHVGFGLLKDGGDLGQAPFEPLDAVAQSLTACCPSSAVKIERA